MSEGSRLNTPRRVNRRTKRVSTLTPQPTQLSPIRPPPDVSPPRRLLFFSPWNFFTLPVSPRPTPSATQAGVSSLAMPYNTTAIPPRKEPTGHTQLPLSRVKKIISQDSDIAVCSHNASFIITCAAEMFIQHLADAALTQVKLERKPRRNIQYKDVANAVSHQDNLEFLEDVIPKTVPYKEIKVAAKETQARLRGDKTSEKPAAARAVAPMTNGTSVGAAIVNGDDDTFSVLRRSDDRSNDPSEQLERETRPAEGGVSLYDRDVPMSG
ncbi:hypothetical protein XA68_11198 [Ophiocordyceps unilateralis]|uniref:Transcription factor CBF/NF-Y/archaeal histone domain-containing protein n=1 Tax=Ophiocordyceps unilateralis TaxID=268505 RepID=A0A2A9PG11_OPHUN|nr:hypothetical protein XA68_11198 [Ophiocordyceps unilateralis]